MEKGITVVVPKWNDYASRTDIKHHTWFKCSNRVLEDEDFFDFNDHELLAWIYILSLCSQKKSDSVFINFERAERFARRKRKDLVSAIEKLEAKQIVIKSVRDPYAIRTEPVRDPCTTGEDRTGEDRTPGAAKPLHPLAVLWNSHTNGLPKVREVTEKRLVGIKERFKECSDLEVWREAIEKIADSDFCNGKISGKKWKATFDFLIRPDTRVKALEGQYDNHRSKPHVGPL